MISEGTLLFERPYGEVALQVFTAKDGSLHCKLLDAKGGEVTSGPCTERLPLNDEQVNSIAFSAIWGSHIQAQMRRNREKALAAMGRGQK